MMVASFIIAVCIDKFGDIATILGATTNSAIGWLLPIAYYLKIEKDIPEPKPHRNWAYACFAFIVISSIIELGTFIYKKKN